MRRENDVQRDADPAIGSAREPASGSIRRVVVAATIGTTLEWYDFLIYGALAALVFNELFFPGFDPAVGALLALSTFAVGFLSRPLGGIIFGHFGDRVGRKNLLMLTLLIMGGATFLIGVLPTYASIGVFAPILLVILRFTQGLGLGGEYGGAVLMVAEHSDENRRGFNTSWVAAAAPAGSALATGTITILAATLSDEAFLAWGWRIPFLFSAVLALVGLWVRARLAESPAFRVLEERNAKARAPLVEMLKAYPRSLLITVGARIGVDVVVYTCIVFSLTYATQSTGVPRSVALNAVLVGSVVWFFALPVFGAVSDRLGRRPTYLLGAVAAAVWFLFAFFPLIDTGSPALIALAISGGLVCQATMYGPQSAFFSELFGTRVRYSGVSVGYQLGGVLGGSLAPIIGSALLIRFESSTAISIYIVAALALTFVAIAVAPETLGRRLREYAGTGSPVARNQTPGSTREADGQP
jgi:metabolite-proton symporter